MTERIMERAEVFGAISEERDYQDRSSLDGSRPDIRPEFSMGTILTAIDVNLTRAKAAWYLDTPPDYCLTTPYLRKIAALCVLAGEKCGMPER